MDKRFNYHGYSGLTSISSDAGYRPLRSLGSNNAALAKNRKTATEPIHCQKAKCQKGEWQSGKSPGTPIFGIKTEQTHPVKVTNARKVKIVHETTRLRG